MQRSADAKPGETAYAADSISVVIPFHEAFEFLPDALASVANQSLPATEVIVVNDGGGEDADTFIRSFPSVTLVSLAENRGVAAARNAGVGCASGDWIAFLDADDIWKPDKLRVQAEFLRDRCHFSACHTGVETFGRSGVIHRFAQKPADLSIRDLLLSSHVTPSSLLVRRSVLLELGGFDETMRCSEDHELTLRMVRNGKRIGFVSECLTGLRRAGQHHLSADGRRIIRGHVQLLRRHSEAFVEQGVSRSAFLASTFLTAGGKTSGLERLAYFAIGRLLR